MNGTIIVCLSGGVLPGFVCSLASPVVTLITFLGWVPSGIPVAHYNKLRWLLPVPAFPTHSTYGVSDRLFGQAYSPNPVTPPPNPLLLAYLDKRTLLINLLPNWRGAEDDEKHAQAAETDWGILNIGGRGTERRFWGPPQNRNVFSAPSAPGSQFGNDLKIYETDYSV